jgi:hypothetical protein
VPAAYGLRFSPQVHRLPEEGTERATITEAALEGEWFYLEEEAPLDRASPEFFILRDGKVQSSTKADAGEYSITDDGVLLTFAPRGPSRRTIALSATGAVFDETTPTLQADATYEMEALDEPMSYYGAFIRRDADSLSTDDVARRAP